MIELSFSKVVEISQALVEEFGEDYIYSKEDGVCVYVHDGAPSCFVGHVLHRAGVPLERLEKADTASWGGGMGADSLIRGLTEEGALATPDSTRSFLSAAQTEQDNGSTWGEALGAALKRS